MLDTAIECLIRSIAFGMDLTSSLKLFFTSLLPFKLNLKCCVRIKLPYSLQACIPANLMPSIWRNLLHIYLDRDYEPTSQFKPKAGWIVIDVGAHIGLYTIRAARLVGSDGVVIAIEPNPSSYEVLKLNLKLNRLTNVIPVNIAISNFSGKAVLYIPSYTANASLNNDYVRVAGYERVDCCLVNVKKLSQLIRDLKLNRIDLLKIDAEGEELKIVEEIRNSNILDIVDRLVIEVHKDVVDHLVVADVLEREGFKVIVVDFIEYPSQAFIGALK